MGIPPIYRPRVSPVLKMAIIIKLNQAESCTKLSVVLLVMPGKTMNVTAKMKNMEKRRPKQELIDDFIFWAS